MGMYEQTPEYQEIRRKQEAADLKVKTIASLFGLFLLVAMLSTWGQVMYGNWKCGFVECRIVIDAEGREVR